MRATRARQYNAWRSLTCAVRLQGWISSCPRAAATVTVAHERRRERIAKEVARGESGGASAAGGREGGRLGRAAAFGGGGRRGGKGERERVEEGRAERAASRRSQSVAERAIGWGRKRAQGGISSPTTSDASRRRWRGASGRQAQSWSVRRPADSRYRRAADFARDIDP